MEANFETYFEFLRKLGGTLEQLTELARKKTVAARNDDLVAVDDCLRQEQALSMTLRGMDQKRETMLDGLGLSGVPLRDLPARCPEPLRAEAKRVSEELRSKFNIYTSAADVARTTLECNLHEIEKYLAAAGGGEAPAESVADIRA